MLEAGQSDPPILLYFFFLLGPCHFLKYYVISLFIMFIFVIRLSLMEYKVLKCSGFFPLMSLRYLE